MQKKIINYAIFDLKLAEPKNFFFFRYFSLIMATSNIILKLKEKNSF